MKGVRVDPAARTARAQAGLTWAEFDNETLVHGLATTGGTVSNTGIAGLTLGGGLGWLMGKHGLTCDNVISVDLVTSVGDVITASEEENADLFWALRGGGGNFGVVTSFQYQLEEAFAGDPDRLARFQREAKVLASLNHPGIAQFHGIEKSEDTQALVLNRLPAHQNGE